MFSPLPRSESHQRQNAMAKRKSNLKPVEEDPSSESASSSDDESYPSVSDSESDHEGGDREIVDVDFEFFDPQEADFHGLKALLNSYLDGKAYSCSELVNTLIQQSTVGTVVKTGEGEDPVGIISVLNLKRHEGLACLAEVKAFLLQNCTKQDCKDKLTEAWSQAGTGLLVSERLLNTPPKLAPPMLEALLDEVQWATEDEPTQELKDAFKLDTYVIFSRVYTDPTPAQPSGRLGPQPSKKQKQKQRSQAAEGEKEVLVYLRPEDQFLHKHSSMAFTFPVADKTVGRDELQPLRIVMLVGAQQMKTARAELDEVVGNVARQAG